MAEGLSGKRTVHEVNAGGKSTLRRFHNYKKIVSVSCVASASDFLPEIP